jgi:hypothetical protein
MVAPGPGELRVLKLVKGVVLPSVSLRYDTSPSLGETR